MTSEIFCFQDYNTGSLNIIEFPFDTTTMEKKTKNKEDKQEKNSTMIHFIS